MLPSPLAPLEGTGPASKINGEMSSAGLETPPSPPLLREARGRIQGRDPRCLQRSSCQVWEKTEIQMVILIFHLANWSPRLLSGALCSRAPQSFALKLAGSIIGEERPIRAATQRNLQEKQSQSGARRGDGCERSRCQPWGCSPGGWGAGGWLWLWLGYKPGAGLGCWRHCCVPRWGPTARPWGCEIWHLVGVILPRQQSPAPGKPSWQPLQEEPGTAVLLLPQP